MSTQRNDGGVRQLTLRRSYSASSPALERHDLAMPPYARNMTHPDSVAPRLHTIGSVRDRLRIEDHNVGKVAFFERASRSRFAPASLGCAGAPSIYRIASRAFIVPSLRTSTVARRPVPAHRSATSGRPGSRNHPTRDRVQGPSFHRGRDTSLRAMHKRCAAQPIC